MAKDGEFLARKLNEIIDHINRLERPASAPETSPPPSKDRVDAPVEK